METKIYTIDTRKQPPHWHMDDMIFSLREEDLGGATAIRVYFFTQGLSVTLKQTGTTDLSTPGARHSTIRRFDGEIRGHKILVSVWP